MYSLYSLQHGVVENEEEKKKLLEEYIHNEIFMLFRADIICSSLASVGLVYYLLCCVCVCVHDKRIRNEEKKKEIILKNFILFRSAFSF
jgi:hypothetical protein